MKLMKRSLVLVLMVASSAFAQGTRDDYARAEQFLYDNVKKLVFEAWVRPTWIGPSRFYYLNDKPDGKEFILVDAANGTRKPAFDHKRLLSSLSSASSKTYRSTPFDSMAFVDAEKAVQFDLEGVKWRCDLSSYDCTKLKSESSSPLLSIPSRDGRYAAFVRNYNLFVKVLASGEEIQLTTDGARFYEYATPIPMPSMMMKQGTEDVVQAPSVFWSPNSKRFVTYVT